MQFGAVHAAPIPTAKLTGFARDLGIIDLPFLFPSREVAYEFMDSDTGMGIMDGLRDSGFEPAMFWESGFKQFTCNHAVNGPEDFANRKVRVMESPLLIAQFRALDAQPVPISFSETYTALQQGVVECQENPLVSIANMKFNEVQDYLMISNHGYLGTAFIFSKVWFDGLPAEDQAILKQAVLDAGTFQREQSVAREQSYLDTIVAEGSTDVIEITDAEMANFRSAMDPVYTEFGASLDDGVLAEVITSVERLSE
jgi:C4-dicarboxylate-binding protein DctP